MDERSWGRNVRADRSHGGEKFLEEYRGVVGFQVPGDWFAGDTAASGDEKGAAGIVGVLVLGAHRPRGKPIGTLAAAQLTPGFGLIPLDVVRVLGMVKVAQGEGSAIPSEPKIEAHATNATAGLYRVGSKECGAKAQVAVPVPGLKQRDQFALAGMNSSGHGAFQVRVLDTGAPQGRDNSPMSQPPAPGLS